MTGSREKLPEQATGLLYKALPANLCRAGVFACAFSGEDLFFHGFSGSGPATDGLRDDRLNWSEMNAWLPALLFGASLFGQQQSRVRLPDETVGSGKIIKTLVSAFDRADIVALGDDHGRKLDSEIRIRLVRDPGFAKKVRFIVVEFGSTAQQPTLDRYIRGEEVPLAELQQVWKTTSQTSEAQTNGVWDSPVYADFFAAVREVNLKLPAGARVRVLAGDPPTGSGLDRDASAVSILKEQVLEKHRKALLIYGPGHLFRTSLPGGIGIAKTLEADYPGRMFVVITQGASALARNDPTLLPQSDPAPPAKDATFAARPEDYACLKMRERGAARIRLIALFDIR